MMSRTLITRSLISLGLAAALSACVSVLPEPKPASSIYRLNSSVASVAPISSAEIIRVDRPSSTQVFNTNDIVVTLDGQKLSAVAQSSWSEAAPVVIQVAMVEALGGSSQFIGLLPTSGARTSTRLHLTIKNFEANFDNGSEQPPNAVVQYRVTYARADDRALIGTYTVKKTHRADSINVSSIVSAIETANQAAMIDIVNWLETQQGNSRS